MKQLSVLIKPASGLCNMRCSYCFYSDLVSQNSQSMKKMTSETAHTLIDRVCAETPEQITYAFQGGEPTLCGLEFFRDFVDYANKKKPAGAKLSFAMQTNGLLLDDTFAAFLAENGFLTGLSMDGSRELHDRLRTDAAGKGTYARVLQTAARLRRHGAEFNILCVLSSDVARHGVSVYESLKKAGFGYLQFIPCLDDFYGEHIKSYAPTPEQYGRFLREVFRLWYNDFMKGRYVSIRYFDNLVHMAAGRPPEMCGLHGRCSPQFVVESDGGVYPCDFYVVDSCRAGDIIHSSFSELSDSPVMKDFVKKSVAPREECGSCRAYPLCRGGCRRERQTDPLGEVGRYRYCDPVRAFLEYAAPMIGEILKRL